MNDWGNENEEFNENQGQQTPSGGPKPLRDAYAAQKARADALEARLAALEVQNKQATVGNLLQAQGVSPTLAKHYTGENTVEAVTQYVNDVRTALGVAPVQPPAAPVVPTLDPNGQAQYQQMMQAGQGGTPQGTMDAALSSVNGAQSLDDLFAAFQTVN